MNDPGSVRPLSGWQRAHIVSAAEYVRDVARENPRDGRARAVYDGLLEVLEPSRRMARQYHERYPPSAGAGSMWDQRSGRERRLTDRRGTDAGPVLEEERRRAQRRSGADRRRG
jgi:hypothetical protein